MSLPSVRPVTGSEPSRNFRFMKITIREERPADFSAVRRLIRSAFAAEKFSDHQEHVLVERLRRTDAFIPSLALVAETGEKPIGYLLMSRVFIRSKTSRTESLALAPVAVLPEYQRQGVGTNLIQEAHKRAAASGYRSSLVLGHPDYYPRFGYQRADRFGIVFPFDVPAIYCMVAELLPGGLESLSGTVDYPAPFYEP